MKKFYQILSIMGLSLLTACNSGSSGNEPTPTIIKHAYIVNTTDVASYTQCGISVSGIEPKTCVKITPNDASDLSYPTAIAFNDGHAYLVNYNSYMQCSTNESGIILPNTCNTVSLASLNIDYLLGIAFNDDYAYITNSDDNGSYIRCNLDSNGIVANSCVNSYIMKDGDNMLSYPTGVSFSGNYVYFTSNLGDYAESYIQCSVNGGVIESNTCLRRAPTNGTANLIDGAGFMAFNSNYAYFPNYNTNNYTQCSISGGVINPDSCSNFEPSGKGRLAGVEAIAFDGNYAYFTNYSDDSYTQCDVLSSGLDLTSCKTVIPTHGMLHHPYGIAFN